MCIPEGGVPQPPAQAPDGPGKGRVPPVLDRSHALLVHQVLETGSSGTHAMTMVEAVLREAGVEREQVECLAIGLGPGSYTGIRAAISVAQGWQLASGSRDFKVTGLSSAECIATQVQTLGISGRISVLIDAQRNELYVARYEVNPERVVETEPLHLANLEEARQRESAGDCLVGPEISRWTSRGRTVFPDAATVARLASMQRSFVRAELLEPIYLRETKFVKAPPLRKLPES